MEAMQSVEEQTGGVLVVDKPAGPTSFDVVQKVRKALGFRKAGHTGTLDPAATGVLPVCLGSATRIAQFIVENDKAYAATLTLGQRTDTLDAQGTVIETAPVPVLGAGLIEAALARFRGPQMQTPPMYSAVRVGGRRLHTLARAGEEIERQARPVTVHRLTLRDFTSTTLQLDVECTRGYFVRVLAQDLATALGSCGHLSALRRTRSGRFTLAHAVPLAEVLANPDAARARLLSPWEALEDLPEVSLNRDDARKVSHGVPLERSVLPAALLTLPPDTRLRLSYPPQTLLAVALRGEDKLSYCRVLGSAAGEVT